MNDALAFTAVTVVRLLDRHGEQATNQLLSGGTEAFRGEAREALTLLRKLGVVHRRGNRHGGSLWRLTAPLTPGLLERLRPTTPLPSEPDGVPLLLAS